MTPFLVTVFPGFFWLRFGCWLHAGHDWMGIWPDQRMCCRCYRQEEWRSTLL